ncbi:MAG: protein translocase subunit SecD [Proteobacteria bacterium]|nr:protein translocase subunit SecD [Pseudomonadota bacterium]
MLRFSRLKTLAVLALVIGSILYSLPSALPQSTRDAIEKAFPAWVPRWLIPYKGIPLGLDLQGGTHVVLEVDQAALIRQQVQQLQADIRGIFREARVAPTGGVPAQPRGAAVRIPNPEDRAKILPKLKDLSQPVDPARLGTGVRNIDVTEQGDLVTLTFTEAGINDKVRRAVDQSLDVFRRRVDPEGTREISIQRQGIDRVLIQVPGLQDSSELREILGKVAKLEFRLVAEPGANPAEVETLPSEEGGPMQVERRVMVDGADLTSAEPGFDQRSGQPIVNFRFNVTGARKFGQVTQENVGKPFAIILDNKIISAPRILSPILGGQGQISGNFTVESANRLAILLRSGALPAAFTIVEERTVGPGLGQDSIDAGKKAAYVAGGLVAFFMIATYGLFGIFANIALIIHILLIFALMTKIGATLTLPGIAGIVLTIGTAVDANVLIYERIREESHLGRSLVASLEAGFNRAMATIIDSNSTMFIAAAILYFLGSGPVRGFAVTMIMGIITTVVTAVTMTRMMIALWYRWAKPKTIPF